MTNIEQFTRELMLAHDIDISEALRRAELFYFHFSNYIPEVLNNDWISVEDRLPKSYERVLIFDNKDGMLVSCILDNPWREATHWQPLPEPPKEK